MSTARLGFEIDSSQAKGASVDLDALIDASKRAERAERDVAGASREMSASLQAANAILKSIDATTRGMSASLEKMARASKGADTATKQAKDSAEQMAQAYGRADLVLRDFIDRQNGVAAATRMWQGPLADIGAEMDRMRARFNPLFAASQAYEGELNDLNHAHRLGAITAREHEAALEALNARYAAMSGAVQVATSMTEKHNTASRMASHNARQLSFQLIDIGQAIPLAFVSPLYAMQNFGFQIAQIGQQYAGQGGLNAALRDSVGMVGRFAAGLAPAIVISGVAAVAFGGLTRAVNDTTTASVKIGDTIGEGLNKVEVKTAALRDKINELGDVTIGFGDVAVGLFQMFGAGFQTYIIDPIKGPVSAAWSAFGGYVGDAFAFVSKSIAAMGAQLKFAGTAIVTIFSNAADQAVTIWSKVPGAMGDIAYQVANNVIGGINYMLSSAASGINWLLDQAKSVGVDLGNIGEGPALGKLENAYAGQYGSMKKSLATQQDSGNSQLAGAYAQYRADIAAIRASDPIATLGENARKNALKDLEDVAKKALSEVEKGARKAAREAERLAKAYQKIVQDARQFVAAQDLERQSYLMTEEAAARLRYEQELVNKAQDAGIKLTATQSAELSGLANQMASSESATKRFKDAIDFAKGTTKGFISDLRQGLANGESFWDSFKNAALNAIDKIVERISGSLVDSLFSIGGSAAGGGGSGIFGGLLGGLGKLLGFASGGYTGNRAASAVAGVVHGQEFVVNAASTRAHRPLLEAINGRGRGSASRGYAMGGYVQPANQNTGQANDNLHVTVGVSADSNGNLMPFVESVSRRQATAVTQAGISAYDRQSQRRLVDRAGMAQGRYG
ncbi:hypothetical protein [Amorphus sp. MBR-141]